MKTYFTAGITLLVIVAGVSAPATAQNLSIKNEIGIDAGDVKVGHASAGTLGIHDGQVTAGAGVADVIQIGSIKASAATQAVLTAPLSALQAAGGLFR